MTGTRGVALLGQLLRHLADAEPMSTAQFAEMSGLPRSSVFQAVRRLEVAGLVARRGGMLYPGPNLIQLGFAAFGLAPLHGPAAALAKLLHDETGGCVTLLADNLRLLRVGSDERAAMEFEAAIGDRACLTLTLPQIPARAERAAADEVFNRVASTLNALLAQAGQRPADQPRQSNRTLERARLRSSSPP